MKFLPILLVTLPLSALAADQVAHQGEDWVRITDKPCVNEQVVARLPTPEDYLAAHAFFEGKHFEACWRPMGQAALVIYEDGDQGLVPAGEFKPVMDL